MVYSMTGFGKASTLEDELTVNVEVKSLNSRFLDLSVKTPRILSDKELEFRNIVKKKVNRGKVLLTVYIERSGSNNNIAKVEEDKLISLIQTLNQVKDKAGISEEISMENILNFQDVIFADTFDDNSKEFEASCKAIELALDNLNKMRADEGKALVEDLKQRVRLIEERIRKIETTQRDVVTEHHDKLITRAKELLTDLDQYDDRLKLELALLAEKYDVAEECTRLKSHADQFNNALSDGKEVGRRLNFLTQEMNREANTINSKSISSDITYLGIGIKEELERIREQIQNIE